MNSTNDFSKGSMVKNILTMAVPLTIAQVVQLLYNIVDRMYIGLLSEDSLALTGMGICFPIISIVGAFNLLFSSGGAPLCSMARGSGDLAEAKKLMGNCFSLLMITGVLVMIVGYVFMKPILFLFGASDEIYPYASSYLSIYLLGTLFVMAGTGMNSFINAQGFAKIGMATTLLGAICNIVLDMVFVLVLRMGVTGAAIATVISQGISAVWVLHFLTGKKAILVLDRDSMKLNNKNRILRMTGLGISGFVMGMTNSLTQIICNATLQNWGGDLYVGIMTVLNSVREIFNVVVQGITTGSQPVISFNYGAKLYKRVKQGILAVAIIGISYTVFAWLIVENFSEVFLRLFTNEEQLIEVGTPCLKLFFGGFYMMSLQFTGQSTFVATGYSKHAVFFSLLRKVFIVVPLTLLLPYAMGVNGVFMAEPISNFLGGTACFITMMFTVWRKLGSEKALKN
jgi:putative MATE family efflux protein